MSKSTSGLCHCPFHHCQYSIDRSKPNWKFSYWQHRRQIHRGATALHDPRGTKWYENDV
jgi:hypothetical protein